MQNQQTYSAAFLSVSLNESLKYLILILNHIALNKLREHSTHMLRLDC